MITNFSCAANQANIVLHSNGIRGVVLDTIYDCIDRP